MKIRFLIFILANFILLVTSVFLLSSNLIFSVILNLILFAIIFVLYFSYIKMNRLHVKKQYTNRFILLFLDNYKITNDIVLSIQNIKKHFEKGFIEIVDSENIKDGRRFLKSLNNYFESDLYNIFLDSFENKIHIDELYSYCKSNLLIYESFNKAKNKIFIVNYVYWIIPIMFMLISRLMFSDQYFEIIIKENLFYHLVIPFYFLLISNITYLFMLFMEIKNIKKFNLMCILIQFTGLIFLLVNLLINFTIFNLIFILLIILINVVFIISEIKSNFELYDMKLDMNKINNYEKEYFVNCKLNDELIEIFNKYQSKNVDVSYNFVNLNKHLCNKYFALLKKKSNNYLLFPLFEGIVIIVVICILVMGLIRRLYGG